MLLKTRKVENDKEKRLGLLYDKQPNIDLLIKPITQLTHLILLLFQFYDSFKRDYGFLQLVLLCEAVAKTIVIDLDSVYAIQFKIGLPLTLQASASSSMG